MKKLIYVLALIFCLSGCSNKYEGWKEIEMQSLGSIKVPEGWTCHIIDDAIYFTDEGVTELTEDNVHLAGFVDVDWEGTKVAYKMFDENATFIDSVKGEVYSNDTFRGIREYVMHGERCQKAYLNLELIEQHKEIFMIAWDDSVSYDDLEKMATSFDRNMGYK